ncbi:MAG: glycosyltransferase involved in cell wall biosynthesis [Bacteroidia bacterium]|jgi:glycosyltransferase involved in cell wall biosynthesis
MEPLVSIVITTYNSADFIGRALDSMINQTYKNIEILISDDVSKDNTREVVVSYFESKNVSWKWFENDVNQGGPAKGRNVGIEESRGEYVCFCDADDEWLPDKLIKQINFISKEEYDFCGTNCQNIGASDFVEFVGPVSLKSQVRRNKFPLSSLIVKKACFSVTGNFNETPDFFGVEDYDLTLRLLNSEFKGGVMKPKLVKYYYLPNSLSHASRTDNETKRVRVLKSLSITNPITATYTMLMILLLKIRILKWNLI